MYCQSFVLTFWKSRDGTTRIKHVLFLIVSGLPNIFTRHLNRIRARGGFTVVLRGLYKYRATLYKRITDLFIIRTSFPLFTLKPFFLASVLRCVMDIYYNAHDFRSVINIKKESFSRYSFWKFSIRKPYQHFLGSIFQHILP